MSKRQHISRTHKSPRAPPGVEPEGISEGQEKQLITEVKLKREGPGIQGTEQRWQAIYRILFPKESAIPTACKAIKSMPFSKMMKLIREQGSTQGSTTHWTMPISAPAIACCPK